MGSWWLMGRRCYRFACKEILRRVLQYGRPGVSRDGTLLETSVNYKQAVIVEFNISLSIIPDRGASLVFTGRVLRTSETARRQRPHMQISHTLLHHTYLLERSSSSAQKLPLQGFSWRRSKLSPEDDVPESACYTESIFVVHEVVLEMIFLQLPPVRRQGSVVQEVVC